MTTMRLIMRRPTDSLRAAVEMDISLPTNADKESWLFASLCGVSLHFIQSLSSAEYMKLAEAYLSFWSGGFATKQTVEVSVMCNHNVNAVSVTNIVQSKKARIIEKISLLPDCRLKELEPILDTIVNRCGGLGWLRNSADEAAE